MGGGASQEDGKLATMYRVASAGRPVFLVGALWLMLAASAVITLALLPERLLNVGIWALARLFALNTVGNSQGPPCRAVGRG